MIDSIILAAFNDMTTENFMRMTLVSVPSLDQIEIHRLGRGDYDAFSLVDARLGRPTRPCIVCKEKLARTWVCKSCYGKHSQSYDVWKAWIFREQAYYQRRNGCTPWNSTWGRGIVYIHRGCVVNPDLLSIKRVKACIGWAVHGLIFELIDGTRLGYVVDLQSIDNDEAIAKKRGGEWVDIKNGDYVKAISGYNLSRACFLCHSIRLELASGQTITFASQHEPWKGEPFRYNLPENSLLQHVSFHKGRCVGVTAAETSLHLPVKSLERVATLPKLYRNKFYLLQLIAQRIDTNRLEKEGERPLGKDLWRSIFCDYLVCRDLGDYSGYILPLEEATE